MTDVHAAATPLWGKEELQAFRDRVAPWKKNVFILTVVHVVGFRISETFAVKKPKWHKQSIDELQDDRELLFPQDSPLRVLIQNVRSHHPEAEFVLEWYDPPKVGVGSFPRWCIVWVNKDPFGKAERTAVAILMFGKPVQPGVTLV